MSNLYLLRGFLIILHLLFNLNAFGDEEWCLDLGFSPVADQPDWYTTNLGHTNLIVNRNDDAFGSLRVVSRQLAPHVTDPETFLWSILGPGRHLDHPIMRGHTSVMLAHGEHKEFYEFSMKNQDSGKLVVKASIGKISPYEAGALHCDQFVASGRSIADHEIVLVSCYSHENGAEYARGFNSRLKHHGIREPCSPWVAAAPGTTLFDDFGVLFTDTHTVPKLMSNQSLVRISPTGMVLPNPPGEKWSSPTWERTGSASNPQHHLGPPVSKWEAFKLRAETLDRDRAKRRSPRISESAATCAPDKPTLSVANPNHPTTNVAKPTGADFARAARGPIVSYGASVIVNEVLAPGLINEAARMEQAESYDSVREAAHMMMRRATTGLDERGRKLSMWEIIEAYLGAAACVEAGCF